MKFLIFFAFSGLATYAFFNQLYFSGAIVLLLAETLLYIINNLHSREVQMWLNKWF